MDLSTTYMGMKLKHPIVPSASPLSKSLDSIRRLEDSGAPAIVMYSLFEEQISTESQMLDHYLTYGTESYSEALSYFPQIESYNLGPQEYLDLIRTAKDAVDIPVIGSLNGVSSGGWIEYARYIEDAGADGLELNVYYIPTDPFMDSAEIEQMYLDVVHDVKKSVTIPVAVKLGPYFTSFANMAMRLKQAGADALVVFNRFYQPDIDLNSLDVVPNLVLSTSHEMRLPLRWVAVLYGRVPVDMAITSGVHTYHDVLKGMMAGANVTAPVAVAASTAAAYRVAAVGAHRTLARVALQYGIGRIAVLLPPLVALRAKSVRAAIYMKVLASWKPDPTGAMPV